MALHGRTTMHEPEQGEAEATVDGVTYRPGDTVLLRTGALVLVPAPRTRRER